MLISDEYRKLNTQLHADRPDYGTSSAKWAQVVRDLASRYQCHSVLDYGCGKGLLRESLLDTSLDIREYDPAIPGKDLDPDPADLVVCTDVLEHIEPMCLNSVFKHIAQKTNKIALLSPALVPAKKKLADGRNAHLIVEGFVWWVIRINPYFHFLYCEHLGNEAVFVVQKLRNTLNA